MLRRKRYDKNNDFNFPIVNFPLCNDIPDSPAYGFVRKDMDVNEHEGLFSIILRHKIK